MVAALAAMPVAAQQPSTVPPKGVPVVPPAATASADLQKAFDDVKQASGRLASIQIPMALEPAFAFHV